MNKLLFVVSALLMTASIVAVAAMAGERESPPPPIDVEGGFTGAADSAPPAPEVIESRAASAAAVGAPGKGDMRQRGTDALTLVGYEPEAVGYSVAFLPGRPGLTGRTLRSRRRIESFIREAQSDRSLAFVMAHELGHAVDFEFGTPERRRRWVEARRIDPGLYWFGCETCDDRSTPAGDFAESFAAWRIGPEPDFESALGPPPNQEQLALLEEFSRAGRPTASPPAKQVEERPHQAPTTTTTLLPVIPGSSPPSHS